MTRARAGAMQSANSRGLLNSSMAAGAGEAAVIDAALPIAQQDANTFSQQRLANQQVSNAADQFGADAANRTVALNTGEANQLGRLKEQGITETGLQTLRGTQSKELAQLEQANRQILQSSDSAGRFFSQTSASISDILKEPGHLGRGQAATRPETGGPAQERTGRDRWHQQPRSDRVA